MYILGIETSCDETAIAILKDGQVLVNLVASQQFHQRFGGVVPEYASREHMRIIEGMLRQALEQSHLTLNEISGIAVTYGPGLMGALLVGLHFAKGLALATGKPLLAVNHVEGHIMANFLEVADLAFPFLCLLVSGGHTQIIYVKEYGKYKILGHSIDDAAGEAFDKGARILGLGYPGGPLIDRLARDGDLNFYHFPRAQARRAYDFSFSGLKTALLYYVRQHDPAYIDAHRADLCAAYQEAIIEVLSINTFAVMEKIQAERLVLAGGVAANSRLRAVFKKTAEQMGVQLFFPPLKYCTDNAAMIARVGWEMLQRQIYSPLAITAIPNLRLSTFEDD